MNETKETVHKSNGMRRALALAEDKLNKLGSGLLFDFSETKDEITDLTPMRVSCTAEPPPI